MKQITSEKYIIGKVIYKVLSSCSELWQMFTDNSFVVFELENQTEGFGYERNKIVISDDIKDFTSYELVKIGLITEKEYELAVKEEELASKKRFAEKIAKEEEEKRIRRKKQYDKLSKEFE